MPESYEKDGVIIFSKPYITEYGKWVFEHLDCDSVISHNPSNRRIISVFCYAKDKFANTALKAIRKSLFPGEKILRGFSSDEVNNID